MNRLKLFVISMLAVGSAYAESRPQNLLELYKQAQSNDSTWAAARSTHAAAQEKLVQGKALTLPTVTLNANANHSNTDLEYRSGGASGFNRQGGGNESFETYGYSVNVNHPLYRKQNQIQFEESKTQVSQADETLSTASLDLMTRTSQAYFDVLLAQDKIDLIEAQKAAITKQLEQAKANFEVGTSTITDVHEAQARYDLLIAQDIAARNDLEIRKRSIQSIIGQMPGPLASAKDSLAVVIPAPQDMEKWVETAEQKNPQLIFQQKALTLATQEVERTHAGHFPTLDAVGSYSDNRANGSINGIGSDSQNFTIGLQLQVPIYQGGAISSREREAAINQQTAKDQLEQTRRDVDLQARQAYLNVASAVAQVKAYEQALASSQSSLDSTSLGYEVGVRTSVDVLNAQQQYYSAKRDLLQARYTWLLSVIKLKAAAGLLTEDDLAATSTMLAGS
jgi:outer membrane protein